MWTLVTLIDQNFIPGGKKTDPENFGFSLTEKRSTKKN